MAFLPLSTLPGIDTSRFECIDGQHLTERPLPGQPHSDIQFAVTTLLRRQIRSKQLRLHAAQEWTVDRYGDGKLWMTPDVTVASVDNAQTPGTNHVLPPIYLWVEILSPGQTLSGIRKQKVLPAFQWGVAMCWVIDPVEKVATMFSAGGAKTIFLDDVASSQLEAGELQLTMPEIFDFED